jgi:predicted naringenin-chalcone synthase
MHYALEAFVPIRPRFVMQQEQLLKWTSELHEQAARLAKPSSPFSSTLVKLLELGSGKDKIQKRGFHICDPFEQNPSKRSIYTDAYPSGVKMKERMQFFDCEMTRIFESFYPIDARLPKHLIHVTCTGYVAPSPAQKIVSLRKAKDTSVTHAYHMGCYAAIPAIRIAAGALALSSPASSVDIVHTEMCSLHFNPLDCSTEQLVVQSLFADGFIKYRVSKKSSASCLKVLALHEELIPDSLSSMSWRCEDICHSMTLSKKVPVMLSQALHGYLSRLVEKVHLNEKLIKAKAYFAIHPGGPKIIQHITQLFHLKEEQISHSSFIMQHCGNMSSATLPHIWEKMLHDRRIKTGSYIVSFAFGPGLTLSGALFQKRG